MVASSRHGGGDRKLRDPFFKQKHKGERGISTPSSSGILLPARWYLLNLLVLAAFKSI